MEFRTFITTGTLVTLILDRIENKFLLVRIFLLSLLLQRLGEFPMMHKISVLEKRWEIELN